MADENPSMMASLASTSEIEQDDYFTVQEDLNASLVVSNISGRGNLSEEVLAMLADCPNYDDEDMKYVDKVMM